MAAMVVVRLQGVIRMPTETHRRYDEDGTVVVAVGTVAVVVVVVVLGGGGQRW
jgi:hypothetical protein